MLGKLQPAARPAAERFSIAIERSDARFDCAADDVLLRAALRAGIEFPYECNSGSCGSCRCQLAAGTVETLWPEAPGLSERDRRKGLVLACQSRPTSDCVLRVAVGGLPPGPRPRRFSAIVTENHPVAETTRRVQVRHGAPADFLPGQYALLTMPGMSVPRAYSMSNLPNPDGTWEFLAKRKPGGRVSGVIFTKLHPGDLVEVDGPYGAAFYRPEIPREIVCLAGGSGIAPLLSIARAVAAAPRAKRRRATVYYGISQLAELAVGDAVRELAAHARRVHFRPVLWASETEEPAWAGRRGLVHNAMLADFGDRLNSLEIYMAGPPTMIQSTLSALVIERRMPIERIHYDRFF